MKTLLTTLVLLAVAGGALAQTPVYFSEYIEGSSYNKAIEIYNATNVDLDLARIVVELYSNGNTAANGTLTLTGTILAGDVWVVAHPSAAQDILDVADQLDSSTVNFNGDDFLMLYFDGVVVDSIGKLGEDPAAGFWGVDPVTTKDDTLVRKVDACDGDTDTGNDYDPAAYFDGYAQNTFTYLGSHTTGCMPVPSEVNSFGAVKSLFR